MLVFIVVKILHYRPTVAGIHGSETEGCYSLALSGGYEDDIDLGNSFTYTGEGDWYLYDSLLFQSCSLVKNKAFGIIDAYIIKFTLVVFWSDFILE